MYSIHDIQSKDYDRLIMLYEQLTEKKQEREKIVKTINEIKNDDRYKLFCVYDEDDNLVATASLSKCFDLTDDARYYYNMENFVVDENCRHKGIGRFLMNELEEYAKNNGGRYMSFLSASSRVGAHKFYERMGYIDGITKGFKKQCKDM